MSRADSPGSTPPTANGKSQSAQHLKKIGWLLAWAVVFCDIGTSVYYVPGILYHHVGDLAPFFVLLTTVGFLLLAQKYAEVSWRNPEGGGVVTVARKAFGNWWGALGGILITIDYFLTSAISSVSGFEYLSSVFPALHAHVVLLSCAGIAFLCLLNIIGIRESATVAFGFAAASLAANLLVLVLGITGLNKQEIGALADAGSRFVHLSPRIVLVGFAGTWLAFSGLESISQISPALKVPIRRSIRWAMIAVIVTVVLTSPTLTALAIAILPPGTKAARTASFISDLAAARGGAPAQIYVVAAASALLLFAANTAMIGGYHVFLALSRDRFFPRFFAKRNQRFSTPHWAILITTAVPIATIILVNGNLSTLGDMYAFGLLGAFTFTAIGLDVIRWRERSRGVLFAVGIVTSIMVAGSWAINLLEKPLATFYGGGLTVFGLLMALAVHRGWIVRALNRIPFIEKKAVEVRARTEYEAEEALEIVGLQSAVAMRSLYPSNTLVAVLGYNEKLLDEAIHRVKSDHYPALYMITVTEWPGLFSGAETEPSVEIVESMSEMGRRAHGQGIFVIPIWSISEDAARMIALAAKQLGCDAVMLGVSQRGAIYRMLRGNVMRGLIRHLPESFKIITVG